MTRRYVTSYFTLFWCSRKYIIGWQTPVPPPSLEPLPADNDPPVGMRPYPQNSEICHKWLRNQCQVRYACKFRHGDLEYDAPLVSLFGLYWGCSSFDALWNRDRLGYPFPQVKQPPL